jgi:hypothetical protein
VIETKTAEWSWKILVEVWNYGGNPRYIMEFVMVFPYQGRKKAAPEGGVMRTH